MVNTSPTNQERKPCRTEFSIPEVVYDESGLRLIVVNDGLAFGMQYPKIVEVFAIGANQYVSYRPLVDFVQTEDAEFT